jgi:hypothetical protein
MCDIATLNAHRHSLTVLFLRYMERMLCVGAQECYIEFNLRTYQQNIYYLRLIL